MMINQRTIARARNVMFAFAAVCLLAQCSEEEDMITSNIDTEQESFSSSAAANISSVTISSANTVVSESAVDCTTCSYVVAKNAQTVDGKELALKPGSIICLDKALKYGDLEFLNFEGEEENPIIIAQTHFPTKN